MNPVDIELYGILDPEHCGGRDLSELAALSAEGGVTLLQYRDKINETKAMVANARAIVDAIAGTQVPLIINDRVDVALAAGAHGVHLGQSDMDVTDARKLLGTGAIIGLSIKKIDEAQACPVDVIDYAFVGGVFLTTSKNNPSAIGLDGWIERANIIKNKSPDLPVGAIAGINAGNVAELFNIGCDGVALISGLYGADDVAEAIQKMKHAIEGATNG